MKKIFLLSLLIALVWVWLVYWPNQATAPQGNGAVLSEDDSLEIIEEELEETTLQEFESELDALDDEINQL